MFHSTLGICYLCLCLSLPLTPWYLQNLFFFHFMLQESCNSFCDLVFLVITLDSYTTVLLLSHLYALAFTLQDFLFDIQVTGEFSMQPYWSLSAYLPSTSGWFAVVPSAPFHLLTTVLLIKFIFLISSSHGTIHNTLSCSDKSQPLVF